MKAVTLIIACAVMSLGIPVAAQVPAHVEYDFSGTGNLMVSPVTYGGAVNSGEPLLVGGTWGFTIDDTGWPGDSDKTVRWNYLDATYFSPNYNSFDADAMIDPDERMMMVVSGTIIVVKNGTGIWAGYCGLGSFSGYTENMDPWNWADDNIQGGTVLDIEDCAVPTAAVSWGQVKSIYSE
ncbi:MAG: hypothetical protein H6Q78_693 [Candidatus Krumholzibacteriota bacterium]|nr:hypothetical protein [Candidatus Krumholzibacteriota bacterium]